MKYLGFAGAMASLALLSACGGGGVGTTPTPTPTPKPVNSTLTNLTVNDTFKASAQFVTYALAVPSGTASAISGGSVPSTAVTYDAASKGYTVQLAGNLPNPSFAAVDKVAAASTPTLTSYAKTSGTRVETFLLFNPGPGNPELALTYASYGAWLTLDTNATSISSSTAFFTYGVRTPSADLPRSGSATYSTSLDGVFVNGNGLYAIGGASAFSADFGASTIGYQMSPTGVHSVNGSTISLGTISGSGTINAAESAFAGSGSQGGYATSLGGFFYGPAAAEMGGTFSITGNGGRGVGALVGKKN